MMIIINLYTTFHFNSLKSVNDLITSITNSNFPLFQNYGTNENSNKKIEESNFKVIAKIVSDYPRHAFGEIYFRTKNKNITLKIENNSTGISRWVLFIADTKFEESTSLISLYPFLEHIISKYNIFFLGGDTQDEFEKLNTRDEINSAGKPTIIRIGFDNINQLPGVYWFNFLSNKFLSENNLKSIKSDSIKTKTFKDGVFFTLTENVLADNKRNKANNIIQSFPENLFYDKNKEKITDWKLEEIIDEDKIGSYYNILLPYFDTFNNKETNQKKWHVYKDKNIDELKKLTDNKITSLFKEYITFDDIVSSIPLIIEKNPSAKEEFEKLIISLGVLVGDTFNIENNCNWSEKKGIFKCSIKIPNLPHKEFSPFFLVLHIIVNELLPKDFIDYLKMYINIK